jgi:hypothetical protein
VESTLGEQLGDIDRVHHLAQSAKLINAFKRVSPTDGRQSPRKDHAKQEEQGDKLELTQEGTEEDVIDDGTPKLSVESDDDEHLDIAV